MAHEHLSNSVQTGLAAYYGCCAALNIGFGIYQTNRRNRLPAFVAFGAAGLFILHAVAYWPLRLGWVIPEPVTALVDRLTNPVSYFVVSTVAFTAVLIWRRFFTEPNVAWA